MAEALLRWMLEHEGVAERFDVQSAGVAPYARDGALVSLDTRFALRDHGIELSDTATSTSLKRNLDLLSRADLVVAMTEEQRDILRSWPEAEGKRIETLRELAGESGDIGDPAAKDEAFFEKTCAEIRRCLEKALPGLLGSR